MNIATIGYRGKAKREGRGPRKNTGELFAETFCVRLLSVSSEKARIQIKRGYLPTYVPDADGNCNPMLSSVLTGNP